MRMKAKNDAKPLLWVLRWLLRGKVNTVPFLAVHRSAAKWTPLRELVDAIPRKMDAPTT